MCHYKFWQSLTITVRLENPWREKVIPPIKCVAYIYIYIWIYVCVCVVCVWVCVCVCVCVVRVYVVYEDTNLYNDMGMDRGYYNLKVFYEDTAYVPVIQKA